MKITNIISSHVFRWSTDDATMKLISPPEVTRGRDKLGAWNMTNITWSVAGKRVDTTFKMFDGTDGVQFMILSQVCVFLVAPMGPGFPEP